MKNRFNRLTSKEWLPFQKSWFRHESDLRLISENVRFFTRAEPTDEKVFYQGNQGEIVDQVCAENMLEYSCDDKANHLWQFGLIDLRNDISDHTTLSDYQDIKAKTISICQNIYENLAHRRFICILIPNIKNDNLYLPVAWDLAWQIGSFYSLKDEKIACSPSQNAVSANPYFSPSSDHFYCLYFRKDENSSGVFVERKSNIFSNNAQFPLKDGFKNSIPSWFILKPTPRKKDEILHPAKYPEDLVTLYVNEFTKENQNVFDPMSGTGSTQVAAIKSGRNGFGTELSDFFAEIAQNRCSNLVNPVQKELFSKDLDQKYKILNLDARKIMADDFPPIDYLITSPPYWDMLNMKGAENQAKRIEKGLQTNYSESTDDLGNIADYQEFIVDLTNVYFNLLDIMKDGSYLTIVVKNIKKKGKNYPFAWDLSDILMQKLTLLPETFWCQDDINLAPYGYGNTFVSNTFHQYCLNFQKK